MDKNPIIDKLEYVGKKIEESNSGKVKNTSEDDPSQGRTRTRLKGKYGKVAREARKIEGSLSPSSQEERPPLLSLRYRHGLRARACVSACVPVASCNE